MSFLKRDNRPTPFGSSLSRSPKARLGRCLVAATVAIACFAASPAHATERGRAERLYTKGLAELHAGHTDAALALFDQAVAADPKDVHSLYYRALGYGHAGRYEEAVVDLKVVVAANDPSIDRDHLELGYALYRLDRYDEAIVELEIAAQSTRRSSGEATMLIGIVETRRGNQDAARTALSKIETMDPSRSIAARYYLGLSAWRSGDTETAIEQFTWVSTQGGDGPYAREAATFLERIKDGGTRPYRLYAGFALAYDSNVALAPNDNTLENNLNISGKDDGRAVMTLGGQYLVYATPQLHLSLGYDFLQSLHFDLDEFNVQTHRVGGQGEYLLGNVTLGLATGYEYSMLDNDSLLSGGSVLPWLRVDEGNFGRSEMYYRARGRNYVLSPYSQVRDSWNHAIGARQFFELGERGRDIAVGYRFDTDDAQRVDGEVYDYNGHQFELGLDWAFDADMSANLTYLYKIANYSKASGNRDDDIYQVIAAVEKRVWEYVWVTGSYMYIRNDSDQGYFDYGRHITSLGVEARY